MNLTPFREDFVGPIEPMSFVVNGLSGTTKVEGAGTVEWKIVDYFGSVQTVRTKAYLIRSIKIRLYSPQFHFRDEQSGSLHVDHRCARLFLPHSNHEVEFPFSPNNLLLMLMDRDGIDRPVGGFARADHVLFSSPQHMLLSLADERNQNLDGPQRELLLWHQKLGHANFDWLQALARHGRDNPNARRVLQSKYATIGNCHAPLCAACQLGKAKRRPTESKHVLDLKQMVLKEERTSPGDQLFIDQYQSSVPSR